MVRVNRSCAVILTVLLILYGIPLPTYAEKTPELGDRGVIIPQAGPSWEKPNPLKLDTNGDGRIDLFDQPDLNLPLT